ncbi:MAG: hypothetical protein U5K54_14045 [Cytophagales bacterium]|nr:hypothetical protein [Cytophagales bacterium]
MPHKKNPDVFELIRAIAIRFRRCPIELTMLTSQSSFPVIIGIYN